MSPDILVGGQVRAVREGERCGRETETDSVVLDYLCLLFPPQSLEQIHRQFPILFRDWSRSSNGG
jgi:hypothetical protein